MEQVNEILVDTHVFFVRHQNAQMAELVVVLGVEQGVLGLKKLFQPVGVLLARYQVRLPTEESDRHVADLLHSESGRLSLTVLLQVALFAEVPPAESLLVHHVEQVENRTLARSGREVTEKDLAAMAAHSFVRVVGHLAEADLIEVGVLEELRHDTVRNRWACERSVRSHILQELGKDRAAGHRLHHRGLDVVELHDGGETDHAVELLPVKVRLVAHSGEQDHARGRVANDGELLLFCFFEDKFDSLVAVDLSPLLDAELPKLLVVLVHEPVHLRPTVAAPVGHPDVEASIGQHESQALLLIDEEGARAGAEPMHQNDDRSLALVDVLGAGILATADPVHAKVLPVARLQVNPLEGVAVLDDDLRDTLEPIVAII